MQTYTAYYTLPAKTEGNPDAWVRHMQAIVIAASFPEAVAKVMAKYPLAKLDNLKHTGTRDIIQ